MKKVGNVLKRIIILICVCSFAHAGDMLCTFDKDKDMNLFQQSLYNYYLENLENIEAINGSTVLYLPIVKKVKTGKLYAMIQLSNGLYLVEYQLKDGAVKKLKDTKMDAYKFNFETNSVILFDDVDDTEWWDSFESEIIERINGLLND